MQLQFENEKTSLVLTFLFNYAVEMLPYSTREAER